MSQSLKIMKMGQKYLFNKKKTMKRILLVLLVSLGLQTQAQQLNPAYFCCDSITYWTDQSQGFNIGLDTTSMIHNPDSIEVLWSICNSTACYPGSGMYAYFGQIMPTDTLKVCYDVWLYEANTMEVCTQCDSLIFDQNLYSWVMFSMQGNPVSINELTFNRVNDNKIYDMLGREVITPIKGVMYIRDNQKFIITQ